VRYVAGLDVGPAGEDALVRAAVAVLSFPDLKTADQAVARRPTSFPYIPGLLSFREIPVLLDAFAKLGALPDLLLCDGQGLAHPRRFGLACHLGVLTGIPSIGVAKSLLVGEHAPLPHARGSWRPLLHKDEVVGAALRTRPAWRRCMSPSATGESRNGDRLCAGLRTQVSPAGNHARRAPAGLPAVIK
jgi:deoxyribonuclease V